MDAKKVVGNQEVTSGSTLASMFKRIPLQDYDSLPVACPGEPGTIDDDKKEKESGG